MWDYLTGADVLPHPYLPRYSVGQYGGVHSFTAEPAEPREERKRDDGSPMGREELRELLIGNVTCGCGDPYAVAQLVLDVLALHPLYEGGALAEQPSDGLWYFVLGVLDSLGLTEHGGSIGGGWLTDKGKATLAALERERNDGFEELFD